MKLDLACGQQPKPGFIGVDIANIATVKHCFDLVDGAPWPFETSSIDELHCSHFIEHIEADYIRTRKGRQDRLFWFFDEAYRVIRPDGRFTVSWPALKSTNAFRDPTHRRFLPVEFTHYLSVVGRKAMCVDHYNVSCNWVVDKTFLAHNKLDEQRDLNRLWDVQEAWTVELIAKKTL